MSIKKITQIVSDFHNRNVTITGGEPLMQKGIMNLIKTLLNCGYHISVETNGTKFMPFIHNRVSWVADYKLPSSGCESQMNVKNYRELSARDFVKFVIKDRYDFGRALKVISLIRVSNMNYVDPTFAFSPAFGKGPQKTLVAWMSNELILKEIGAIYSLQLHKILGVA
jgi:7-carboxy-7-deazaguanine synthase